MESIISEGEMTKRNINRYLKSRWDARFLINTIMGLLALQRGPHPGVVMAIVTAAIRSYSRACLGNMNKKHEEGIYETLKDYAKERIICKGKDLKMMECFVALMDWTESESEVWAFDLALMDWTESESEVSTSDFANKNIEKSSASFPMDCLTEEQSEIVTNQSWERFRAKFYTSDGQAEKGLLVFEDKDGSDAFKAWMDQAHSDLIHQTLEDRDSE